MEYSAQLKNARMQATRDALAGGRLELGTVGMRQVLASLVLGAGRINDGNLTFTPEEAVAIGDGMAVAAHIRTADGVAVAGLTVGFKGSAVTIELGQPHILPGTVVTLSEFTLRHT